MRSCAARRADAGPPAPAFLARGTRVCSDKRVTREVRGSLPSHTEVPCWPKAYFVLRGLFGLGVTSGIPAGEKGVFASVERAGRCNSATLSCAEEKELPRPPALVPAPQLSRRRVALPAHAGGQRLGSASRRAEPRGAPPAPSRRLAARLVPACLRAGRESGAQHPAGSGLGCARRNVAGGRKHLPTRAVRRGLRAGLAARGAQGFADPALLTPLPTQKKPPVNLPASQL